VRDYLDGTKLPAEQAWYVFGSRLVGPHGDDLIPLASKTRADLFVRRYGGTKIMDYKELRSKGFGLIKYLDM
jgi:nitrous oxide reductase accessory protein NosL